jgi:hypothetical protein
MVTITVFGTKFHLKQLRAPRFKKGYTVMSPLPWSRLRQYLAGRPETIVRVNNAFAAAGHMTAGFPLRQRMEIIGDAMRGKTFGGAERVIHAARSREEVERMKREVAAAVERARAILAPPPAR